MVILPPAEGPVRPERRSRDRRVSDRRRAAKATVSDVIEPEGAGAQRVDESPVEPAAGAAFQARGRGAGRRKTDRDASAETEPPMRSASKPHAPLVAQLIATALDLEQTRVKRRGSEKDAAALYGRKATRARPPRGTA